MFHASSRFVRGEHILFGDLERGAYLVQLRRALSKTDARLLAYVPADPADTALRCATCAYPSTLSKLRSSGLARYHAPTMIALGEDSGFEAPPWGSPLDPVLALKAVPENGQIAGMFAQAVLEGLKQAGVRSPAPRDRYLPFGFYPQREHAKLLLDAAALLFPQKSTRAALRSLGRAAPAALLRSTLGRVSLGAARSAEQAVRAMVGIYPVNVRPSEGAVVEVSDTHALVTLRGIHFFLDSHHVGVLEGTLRYAGVNGEVRIRTREPGCADLLCSWH